jgi:hypothetical protein
MLNVIMLIGNILSVNVLGVFTLCIMLSVNMLGVDALCHYAGCHNAECHFAECHNAEYHSAHSICVASSRGLFYRTLQTHNLQKMDRFCNKLVSFLQSQLD